MAGTRVGALKAVATKKSWYGLDFYSVIGIRGGSNGRTGGFYARPELASTNGAKGGKLSKRGPAKEKSW